MNYIKEINKEVVELIKGLESFNLPNIKLEIVKVSDDDLYDRKYGSLIIKHRKYISDDILTEMFNEIVRYSLVIPENKNNIIVYLYNTCKVNKIISYALSHK